MSRNKVSCKTDKEVGLMREAGKRLAEVLLELERMIKPGISTMDINKKGDELIRKLGGIPNFLNYNGFPASFCISVNDQVVHGIPHPKHIIDEGDIVSIDGGLIYKGYHSDAARTIPVGEVDPQVLHLIRVTEESFFEGIKKAVPGGYLGDISEAIGNYVEKHGYSVVKDLCGHGIGKNLHEAPDIFNFKQETGGIRLEKNMTFAIEPMVNMGDSEVEWDEDGWTVYTADYSFSAHYENTIVITENGPEILTLLA